MNDGYLALSSILVISAVAITVVALVPLLSISGAQTSLEGSKQESSLSFVESCAEEALIQLNRNNTVTSPVVLPQGNCTVTINSQVGSTWTFTVNAAAGGYTKSIQITALRGNTVDVTSWKEL